MSILEGAAMEDQAATLRAWSKDAPRKLAPATAPLQVIAVGGGKGGIGKTSITANLVAKLAKQNKRVLALDGDMGLANLDIALGVRAHRSLLEILDGESDVRDIVVPTPSGVDLLAGCSGRFELANMSEREQQRLLSRINDLENAYDVLVVDTAAGIGANAMMLAAAAQQVVVVVTPDPSSFADAYAFIKVLSNRFGVQHFHVLANMTRTRVEGEDLYGRLSMLAERFLAVRVEYLGNIPRDAALAKGMRQGVPAVVAEPYAPASQAIATVCRKLLLCEGTQNFGSMRLFWQRILQERASA